MKPILFLVLVTAVVCGVRADSDDDCPLWHYRQKDGKCRCGSNLNGAIICSDSMVYLRIDYAMDVLGNNTTIVAVSKYVHNDYLAIPSHLRVYSMIPNTTPQEKLNGIMCNKSNREGFLCGKCLPHHGPIAYYYKCIQCDYSLLPSIIIYLIIKLLPVTVLFIAVIIFRFNITKGPFLGYISFCQFYSIAIQKQLQFYELLLIKLKHFKVFLTIPYYFSSIWNLDLQPTGFIPHFCLSSKLTDIDVLFLNFIILFFNPLFLVIITYILIELHAHNCRVLVLCWKPFNFCFATFRRNLSTSDSVIHAFASIMLLSFLILNYNVYSIFNSINVYTANSSNPLLTGILQYHPTTTHAFFKKTKYICYFVISIMLLFFLSFLPSLLLLLYPIRKVRVQLQRLFSQRILLKLDTFVETFQGPFKDGLNGTRDFRIVPGILAFMIFFLNLFNCLRSNYEIYLMLVYVVVLALISLICAYVHPFKSSSGNLSVTFHFILAATIGTLFILFMEDLDMDTNVLVSAFAILVPLPHLVMFVWVCYKIQKKLNLRQRCVDTFCYISGRKVFGREYSISLLPDRLLHSNEYRELLD